MVARNPDLGGRARRGGTRRHDPAARRGRETCTQWHRHSFLARTVTSAHLPFSADAYRFDTEFGPHVFLPDGSRIYAIDAALDIEFAAAAQTNGSAVQEL